MGKRPKVRGVAMNPVDHPNGGGEGRTSGGGHPVSPWGTPSKGYRTRKKNKTSNKFIVKKKEIVMPRSLKKDHILILSLKKKVTAIHSF